MCSEINRPEFLFVLIVWKYSYCSGTGDCTELQPDTYFLQGCCATNFMFLHNGKKTTIAFSWKKNTFFYQHTFRDSYSTCHGFSKGPWSFY
jgi:hypothetical protein